MVVTKESACNASDKDVNDPFEEMFKVRFSKRRLKEGKNAQRRNNADFETKNDSDYEFFEEI